MGKGPQKKRRAGVKRKCAEAASGDTIAGGRPVSVGGTEGLVPATNRSKTPRRRAEDARASESDAQILAALGGALIAADDPQAIYERVIDAAVALMRSQFASMQMYHPDETVSHNSAHSAGQLELLAHRGFSREAAQFWHWVGVDGSSTCSIAFRTGRRVVEPDVANSRQMSGGDDQKVYLAAGIRAVQSTPLVSRGGELLGMISTHWDHPHQPSEAELRNFDILARQAADIIERHRTEGEIRQNQAWLAGQKQALQAALGGAPLQESLAVLVDSSIEHYGPTTRGAFYRADRDGKTLYHVVGMVPEYARKCEGFPIGPDSFACGLAIHQGRPILTTDVRHEPLWEPWLWVTEKFDFRACGSFPLQTAAGKVIGTFAVYWREPHEATRNDVAFANTLADTASIMIARHIEAEERKRAEAALRASAEKYRTLFESIDEGFCVIELIDNEPGEPVDFRMVEVNPAYERASGLKNVVGKRISEIAPGVERHRLETYARVARTGEPQRIENYVKDLDRWFRVYVSRAGDANSRQCAIVFDDVTDRKKSELALKASEERHSFLLKLSDVLRPLADPAAIKAAACRALGGHLKVNRAFYAAVEGDDWAVVCDYEQGVSPLRDGLYAAGTYGRWIMQTCRAGERIVFRDTRSDPRFAPAERDAHAAVGIVGAVGIPLVKGGTLVAILAVHTAEPRNWSDEEIALIEETAERTWTAVERASAESALRVSEERLQRMINVGGVGVLTLELATGTLIGANDAFLDMTGYSREQIERRELTWQKLTPPEYIEASNEQLRKLNGRVGPYEKEYFTADGSRSWMLFAGANLGDGTVVKYCIDVSDRKQAEEALREGDRRKDEYLAMLAHELRNPLGGIRNAVNILLRSQAESPGVRSATEILDRQVTQMTRQVDDLLDVSRISRGKIELRNERIDLLEIVNDAVRAQQPFFHGARLELTVKLPPQPLHVQGDSVRLVQIVGNLLNNACKFTQPGGQVWLTVERDGERAVIRVRDTGIGIAAGDLARIFEVFAQVDNSLERTQSGLGLGLALVQKLVEMHQGTVEARSDGLGRGSEFVVRLPLVGGAAGAHPGPSSDVTSDSPGARRILVAEDNADLAASMGILLRTMGYKVELAHDGLDAVQKAETFRPEVILMDIGMPRLNGYEAAGRIRQLDGMKGVKLVALTGWGQADDRRRSEEAGFDVHLAKPLDVDALSKLLAEWAKA